MEADFWHNLWESNNTGWHLNDTNPFLETFFGELKLEKNARVFIPLCGKTLDIAWLLSHGYKVVGAELNEKAIQALFKNLDLEPTIQKLEKHTHYQAKNIDIFVGNLFDLTQESLGKVDAIYDRGALVALPKEMRVAYGALLKEISQTTPQLLINYEYDQNRMDGPPFSISQAEIESHYGKSHTIKLLKSFELREGPFGEMGATENVWLLT